MKMEGGRREDVLQRPIELAYFLTCLDQSIAELLYFAHVFSELVEYRLNLTLMKSGSKSWISVASFCCNTLWYCSIFPNMSST
jgi:hypothetical protein